LRHRAGCVEAHATGAAEMEGPGKNECGVSGVTVEGGG
jgi:hypothetical protein